MFLINALDDVDSIALCGGPGCVSVHGGRKGAGGVGAVGWRGR